MFLKHLMTFIWDSASCPYRVVKQHFSGLLTSPENSEILWVSRSKALQIWADLGEFMITVVLGMRTWLSSLQTDRFVSTLGLPWEQMALSGDNERKCSEGTTSQLWAGYQGTWRDQGAKGRTTEDSFGLGRAACHMWRTPSLPLKPQCHWVDPWLLSGSSLQLKRFGGSCEGGLLGHGGGAENGSGGEEEKTSSSQ